MQTSTSQSDPWAPVAALAQKRREAEQKEAAEALKAANKAAKAETDADRALRSSVQHREYLHWLPQIGDTRATRRAKAEASAAVARRVQRRIAHTTERWELAEDVRGTYDEAHAATIIAAFDDAADIVAARQAALATRERIDIELQLNAAYRDDIAAAMMHKYDRAGGGKVGRKIVDDFDERHGDFDYYACDDADIISLANQLAERCSVSVAEHQHDARKPRRFAVAQHSPISEVLHSIADAAGIKRATADADDPRDVLGILFAKYTDATWWRTPLRRMIRPRREQLAIDCGLVGKGRSKYSSRLGQQERREQLRRNERWAKATTLTTVDSTDYSDTPEHLLPLVATKIDAQEAAAIASDGDTPPSLNMAELIESQKNCYQAELTTMVRGLSDMQDSHGWDAAMITITCPGDFRKGADHPTKQQTQHPDDPRPDFSRPATVAEGVAHLRNVWNRIRPQAHRDRLDVRGVRVTQPHADATAHEHMFCIGSTEDIEAFAAIVREHACALYPDEDGAAKRRVDIMWEDREKGRLSSYAARYVTRFASHDGDTCATDTGTAEDAYYAAHGIRRVGFFGLPPKVLWQHFYHHATPEMVAGDPVAEAALAAVQNTETHRPSYNEFCEAIGWDDRREAAAELPDMIEYRRIQRDEAKAAARADREAAIERARTGRGAALAVVRADRHAAIKALAGRGLNSDQRAEAIAAIRDKANAAMAAIRSGVRDDIADSRKAAKEGVEAARTAFCGDYDRAKAAVAAACDYETITAQRITKYGEQSDKVIGIRLGACRIFKTMKTWFVQASRNFVGKADALLSAEPTRTGTRLSAHACTLQTEREQSTVTYNSPRKDWKATDAAFDAMLAVATASDPVPIPF